MRFTLNCLKTMNSQGKTSDSNNLQSGYPTLKYKRARSVFLNVATGSGTMSVALSAGGLGTAMTGVGLPVAVSSRGFMCCGECDLWCLGEDDFQKCQQA